MMPGPVQIAIILFVILLLFGAKKLPALARSVGQSMTEFNKGRREGTEDSLKAAAEENAEKSDETEKEKETSAS